MDVDFPVFVAAFGFDFFGGEAFVGSVVEFGEVFGYLDGDFGGEVEEFEGLLGAEAGGYVDFADAGGVD